MTKLKTLKDIKGIYSDGNSRFGPEHTNTKELRKEAINRAKAFKICLSQCSEAEPVKMSKENFDEIKFKIEGKIEEIIEFFNLSEEEIK